MFTASPACSILRCAAHRSESVGAFFSEAGVLDQAKFHAWVLTVYQNLQAQFKQN